MTPEGKVKKQVSAYLKSVGYDCYYFMPVQQGYGKASLDYIGAFKGRAFAIETKAEGKPLTPLQLATVERMERAGIKVFTIAGVKELNKLFEWFNQ